MPIENTPLHFLYRQLFTTPAPVAQADHDLAGLTGLVMGSNTGLGYHASQQLLSLGLSRLILAVRNVEKGEAAKGSLLSSLKTDGKRPSPEIEVWELDMMSYESIFKFSRRARETQGWGIDIAILNAGVVRFDFQQVNGQEITILTNWLGTALLAATLRPVLQAQYETRSKPAAKAPVLTIVGSDVAQMAAFKKKELAAKQGTTVLEQLNKEENFDRVDRYYTSKLLLLMFFIEFCARIDRADNKVVVNLVTPGFCYGSDLYRSVGGIAGKLLGVVKRILGRSTPVGARTLVHAAVAAGEQSHGKYLMDQKVAPFADYVETENGQMMLKQLWREIAQEFGNVVDLDSIVAGKK